MKTEEKILKASKRTKNLVEKRLTVKNKKLVNFKLRYRTFYQTRFSNVTFINCDILKNEFILCVFDHCTFINCTLNCSSMLKTEITDCTFTDVSFNLSEFISGQIARCRFTSCTYLPDFTGTYLQSIRFSDLYFNSRFDQFNTFNLSFTRVEFNLSDSYQLSMIILSDQKAPAALQTLAALVQTHCFCWREIHTRLPDLAQVSNSDLINIETYLKKSFLYNTSYRERKIFSDNINLAIRKFQNANKPSAA